MKQAKDSFSGNVKVQQRSPLMVMFGKTVIFMTIVSFLFVGLWINLLQVLLLLGLKLNPKQARWRQTIKWLNGQLLYMLFSPCITMIYYWSNINLNIQLSDVQLIEESKKPLMAIIVPNHTFELDYMVCFVLADQLGNLGSYKSMSKDELKYLPIVGWGLWMSDIIFVKRNWQKDRCNMAKKLDELYDYDQFMLGLFAEGTRWTPEKHEASVKFAKSQNLEPLKYHLMPRTRGFTYTIRHYLRDVLINKRRQDEKLFKILNLEIMLPDRPKFRDWLNGDQLNADVYCEEVEVTQEVKDEVLSSRDEAECPKLTELLIDIYRRKDKLVEEYEQNGSRFVVDQSRGGGPFPFKRRFYPLLIWLLGFLYTHGTLFYLGTTRFSHSPLFWSLVITFVASCLWMLKRVERESQATNSILERRTKDKRQTSDSNNHTEKNIKRIQTSPIAF